VATRDHTERMLRARGVEVTSEPAADGWHVSIAGPASVHPRSETVPGDISAAMFWLVGAAIHPDADLVLEAVGVNPTRSCAIDLLRAMGAEIEVTPARDADPSGEPTATLRVRSSRLEGVRVPAEDVARSIDEIPALAIAAAFARGTSRFEGVDELRRKESDRVAGVVAALRALGVACEVDGDALEVHGVGEPLRGLAQGDALATLRDHRLVMAFAVAGLATDRGLTVTFPDAASVSYPGFFEDLERVRT
jgi:3-phosphoshikimate 1-carboxyvinyltransferase